ncbi:MAG: ATP-binding protein [Candidatus Latescibacteria bacterium]|jgi:signal transduction histidine kinase|nr:ATP-binding protein [Candidatus Latescibacterota bacterium]
MLPRCYIATLLLSLLGAVPAAHAHNGRLAMAAAVDGIVVDGDLHDWPRHLPRYPVSNPAFGQPPSDDADLSATFRVAYDVTTNRLLVGVEVRDESVVIPDSPTPTVDWQQADGCELYLDITHQDRPAVRFQFARWGQTNSVRGRGGSLSKLGLTNSRIWQGDRILFDVAMSTYQGVRFYEWWVDMGTIGTGLQLAPGVDIAFDVAVEDLDEDGSFTWMSWGPDTNKLEAPGRLGDLLIGGDRRSFGETMDFVGDLIGRTQQRAEDEARRDAGAFTFLSGAMLAVTLLHLMLYLFQRESRVNLYHALFSGATSIAIGLAYFLPSAGTEGSPATQVASLWVIVIYAASLLLLYSQFHGRVTRAGKFLLAWLGTAAAIRVLFPASWPVESSFATGFWSLATFAYMSLVMSFVTIGALVFGAVVRRRDGAWSVGVSFLVFAACAGLVVVRLGDGVPLHPWLLAGILLPLASMSFRLARGVGEVHRDLGRRYEEVEQLSDRLAEQNRTLELANIKIREGSRRVEEADRLKSAFLAHMSHDLRTPLNAIIGYTRILLRRVQGSIDERQYRNLENVRVSADNLLTLINDILDLSRIESGRTEIHLDEVDVHRLAGECLATLESLIPDGVELVGDLEELAPVTTDGDRRRRVLMNLLGNAVKYTETGRITLRLQASGDGLELSVTDSGVGIPPEDLDHVFDEFRQVERKDKKREGSGLGLAIVRRSIEMLGGSVHATSTLGVGSTFSVRLPTTPPDRVDPPPTTDG